MKIELYNFLKQPVSSIFRDKNKSKKLELIMERCGITDLIIAESSPEKSVLTQRFAFKASLILARLIAGKSFLTQRLRLISQIRLNVKPSFLLLLSFLLTFTFFSCGEWGWQKVEYDFESQLNVFGMIMLGDELESYVVVQQSIDLQVSDMAIAGYDTIIYGPDSTFDIAVTIIEKSAYVVDDATVFITDGIDTSYFYMPPFNDWDSLYGVVYEGKYSDTLNTFHPQPNTTYTLHVSTPDGRVVVGKLITPDLPYIHSNQVPDTVYNKHQYTIPFRPIYDEDIHLRIRTGSTSGYWECGMNQTAFIDYGDTTWTSTVDNCSDWWMPEEYRRDSIRIELQAMDQNYYDYFIKNSESVEYINFIMGDEGSTGKGFGLEGGMGVFGAMAIDAIDRVYVPW